MAVFMLIISAYNISCDFSQDLCHWEPTSGDQSGRFIWTRKNGEELGQEGAMGPATDRLDSATGYFVFARAAPDLPIEPFTTLLASPYLIGSQHPIDCLSFWFSMSVSTGRLWGGLVGVVG